MSRSFRESYLGKPRKPWRSWRKNPKPVRKLRRDLAVIRDEENKAATPQRINRKWMGYFTCRVWSAPDYMYGIARRNGRKFLLKRKNFEPDEYYWSRNWRVCQK